VAAAAAELAPLVSEDLLTECVADVPDEWLAGEPDSADPDELRGTYVEVLAARSRTVHEHITLGPPGKGGTPRPPGWLTEEWPHRKQGVTQ
jgi:hypothetical protein